MLSTTSSSGNSCFPNYLFMFSDRQSQCDCSIMIVTVVQPESMAIPGKLDHAQQLTYGPPMHWPLASLQTSSLGRRNCLLQIWMGEHKRWVSSLTYRYHSENALLRITSGGAIFAKAYFHSAYIVCSSPFWNPTLCNKNHTQNALFSKLNFGLEHAIALRVSKTRWTPPIYYCRGSKYV